MTEQKKYQIIYADPPWKVMRGPSWSSNKKSLPLPYPTMSVSEISSMNVKDICDKDAHLYLWTINKYIEEAYSVARCWGFNPICLLTWCKPKHGLGLGGTFVQTSEHLLFCRKGHLKSKKRIDCSWFAHKRLEHSVKPCFFRDMIVEVSGDVPRVELFARQANPGWDIWGNELENSFEFENVR